ncbi:hypothetical protein OQA88_6117 [Cercophora sp. LCS_1]
MYDYLKTSAKLFPFLGLLSFFPSLTALMSLDMVKKYAPSVNDSIGFGRLLRRAKEVANSRFPPRDGEMHQDMLGSFIRHGLTKDEAESETIVQILAGAETTATTIRMILFYLFTNPRVLSKLRRELDEARPSSPITYAEASRLPYLQAVIKEGLRICPPTTGIMLKEVPEEGISYQDRFIPGGTGIGLSVLAIFNDRGMWGEDAAVFRPERFLHGTADELQERENVVDAGFGHGKWKCLGRSIALVEISKAVTEMVRAFELEIMRPDAPFKMYDAGLQIQWDMWMRATLHGQN